MSEQTRYSDDGDIVIGALLVAFEGPFGTAIITRIEGETVHLERPHMRAMAWHGAIVVERYTTTTDSIARGNWRVWTRDTRGTLDTRGD